MSNGTIMIAEDESRIRRMVKDFLNSCNYTVIEAEDGKQATELFYSMNSKIDLIILDVMMPFKDGFEVLSEIRDVSLVPVIMLTAKSQEYDQLFGFKHGADDYITKPFSPILLIAHIEAILRRCKNNNSNQTRILGAISINTDGMIVKVNNQVISLTPKEYDLLLFFADNINLVLTRERILNEVWNYDYIGDVRTVDTHIKQLRSKIGTDYIQTIHGKGYRFEVSECFNQ
jgi:Response regulators consisting of a CheY-like receiver domain and a winged-helix DNA-binding domain